MRYQGAWANEGFAVLVLCGLISVSYIWRKIHWSVSLLGLWVLAMAFRIYAVPGYTPYTLQAPNYVDLFDSLAASSIAQIALMGLALYSLPIKAWKTGFKSLALANGVLILGQRAFKTNPESLGVLFNSSMGGCFQLAMLPLFFGMRKADFAMVAGIALSILACGRSQPIAGLALLSGVLLIRFRMWKTIGVISGAAFIAVPLIMTHNILESSGRFNAWRMFWSEWRLSINPWLGSGTGSFPLWGIMITAKLPWSWTFAHSDWFQLLFEQGIPGLGLGLLCFAVMIKRSLKCGARLLCVLFFGLWMVANMPWHFMLTSLYGAFLVRWVFDSIPDDISHHVV